MAAAGEFSNGLNFQSDNSNLQTSPREQGDTSLVSLSKRRPGRPKGSRKKYVEDSPSAPKTKRPVGRPRKDGLPAGSSASARRNAPRKDVPAKMAVEYYPTQWPVGLVLPPSNFSIDPSLDNGDDWNALSVTRPNVFLTSILASLSAPNPVSSAGPSVEEAFKSHLVSVAPNVSQTQPIPSLYSILKTFWLPSSPAYFSLTASASTARTPSEHRFLYWDPQPLVFNGIGCPHCASPLANLGRIRSGPIKIYDLERPFFIIGCEYVCRSATCVAATGPDGRKFASTDSSIIRSLPARLKDEFPAHLNQGDSDAGSGPEVWNWQAMGVSRSLWNMIRASLRTGLGKEAILYLVRSIQNGGVEHGHEAPAAVASASTNQPAQEEDETDEGEEGEEEMPAQEDHSADPALNKDNFPEAYANAWKDNSAIINGAENVSPSTTATPSAAPVGQPDPNILYSPYPFPNAYSYFPPPGSAPPPNAMQQEQLDRIASTSAANSNNLKRPFPFSVPLNTLIAPAPDQQQASTPPVKRQRHCCKCGGHSCKGKGGRSFCMNACQDCGKLDCKGRNSRRPDKRCEEAWL